MECLCFVNSCNFNFNVVQNYKEGHVYRIKMKDVIGDVVLVTRGYIPIDIVNQREDNQFVLISDPLIMPRFNCFLYSV